MPAKRKPRDIEFRDHSSYYNRLRLHVSADKNLHLTFNIEKGAVLTPARARRFHGWLTRYLEWAESKEK